MKMQIFQSLVLCIFTLSTISCEKMCPCDLYFEPEIRCVFEEVDGSMDIERMTCYPLGTDDRHFGEVLQQTPAYSSRDAISSSPKGFHFDETAKPKGRASDFAIRVKELRMNVAGNLEIDNDDMANFTNLEKLFIFGGRYRRSTSPHRHYRLSISPNAFRANTKLENVRLVDHLELPQESLEAFGSLKDKLTSFSVWDSEPSEGITNLTGQLNKVRALDIVRKHAPSKCSDNMFKGSASTLKRIHLQGCNNTHLPKSWFKDLRELKNVRLVDNGFTSVEPGAFDDLGKLENLHVQGNKIRRLPDGIFIKLSKLVVFDLGGSQIENLSSKNFTSKDFEQLSTAPQCCPCKDQ